MRTRIVYEDNDIIVIYKPAGIATQTARVGQQDVVSELKNYLADRGAGRAPYLGIVHRLDQPVEGLLVFAKTQKAAGRLKGQMNKRYYGVFCGKPERPEAELVDYLIKTADNRAQIATAASKEARKAVLHYRLLQTICRSGEELSLVDIEIQTGRFHQIRAQMRHAGMALLGDVKYADDKTKACSARLGVGTVALCAYQLSLSHPVTGACMEFRVEPEGAAFRGFFAKQ